MRLTKFKAPARRIVCAGAFACLAITACENAPKMGGVVARTIELNNDTITIDPGVTIHDVQLHATQSSDFSPAQVVVHAGDIVRFTSADTRTHALVINAPTPEATAALQATGQQRSPPMIARGTAWIVSFKNLPPGNYSVSCISHAGRLALAVE